MNEVSSPAGKKEHSDSGAKGVWEAPTIEEVDFTSTEAAIGPPGGPDGGFYAS